MYRCENCYTQHEETEGYCLVDLKLEYNTMLSIACCEACARELINKRVGELKNTVHFVRNQKIIFEKGKLDKGNDQ